MALPDLSHFRNPDPVHIVIVKPVFRIRIQIQAGQKVTKKGKKQEISLLEELFKVLEAFPLVTLAWTTFRGL
jgi:hypothetical protein